MNDSFTPASPTAPTAADAQAAGEQLGQLRAPRPYWQTRPCPDWCERGIGHNDHDHPADRAHYSNTHEVQLFNEPPIEYEPDQWGSETLAVYLRGHVDEVEPVMHFGRGDEAGMTLRLDEVDELIRTLIRLRGVARRPAGAQVAS